MKGGVFRKVFSTLEPDIQSRALEYRVDSNPDQFCASIAADTPCTGASNVSAEPRKGDPSRCLESVDLPLDARSFAELLNYRTNAVARGETGHSR